jgi:UPF0716 protein FxsA
MCQFILAEDQRRRAGSQSGDVDPIYRQSLTQNQFTRRLVAICRGDQLQGHISVARLLLLGLVVLPIVEIAIFIKVGQSIGLLPTLALIIGAAILGGLLLAARRLPGQAFLDAALIGVAAVLLVLPGFLSDFVALALLLPPVRAAIYGLLARHVTVVASGARASTHDAFGDRRVGGPATIDLDDDDYRPR